MIKFSVILLLLVGGQLYAQPVLTKNGMTPSTGEKFTVHFFNAVPAGPAGPNQTWDLSTQVQIDTNMDQYYGTSICTAGGLYHNLFLRNSPVGGGFLYITSDTNMKEVAYCNFGAGTAVTTRKKILKFPFAYNEAYTTLFDTSFISGVNGDYHAIHHRMDAISDGYGTLITPVGTWQNVMRVKYIITEKDTDIINFGPASQTNVDTITNISYAWYKEDIHHPVAYLETGIQNHRVLPDPVGTNTFNANPSYYISYISVGLNDQEKNNGLLIYPSPARDFIYIQAPDPSFKNGTVMIYNFTSQLILKSIGSKINVENLPPGLYILKTGQWVGKFYKE